MDDAATEMSTDRTPTGAGEEDDVQIFSADEAKRAHNQRLYDKIEKELEAMDVDDT